MTFMDEYQAGRIDGTDPEMNRYVACWFRDKLHANTNGVHCPDLAEYLGMTREQLRTRMFDKTMPERGAP